MDHSIAFVSLVAVVVAAVVVVAELIFDVVADYDDVAVAADFFELLCLLGHPLGCTRVLDTVCLYNARIHF